MSQSLSLITSLDHSISIHVPVSSIRHFTEPFCLNSCPSLFCSSLHWTILSLFMSQSLPLTTSVKHSISIHVPVSSTHHFIEPFYLCSCPSLFHSPLHWTILSLFMSQSLPLTTSVKHSISIHVPVSSTHHFSEPFYLYSCPSLFHSPLQ